MWSAHRTVALARDALLTHTLNTMLLRFYRTFFDSETSLREVVYLMAFLARKSVYSCCGVLLNTVGVQSSGERKAYVLVRAWYTAIAKLPLVRVCPVDDEYTSSTPAMVRSFLGMRDATMPEPRGAGIKRTRTEPHLPDTLHGTVWGAPALAPQYPRRTGTKFILALMMPPLIAVATSLAALTPRPMWPAPSPTAT